MNKIIKYYILSIIFLAACARPVPPSGGPPDKTPPVIVGTYPENKMLNYKKDYVQFEFNKYMNNNSVIENIYIIPDIKTTFDWSGKELEVTFGEAPDTNTTYAVIFGTEYTDYLGNKPEESFTLVFSTGSSIDSGSIKGIIQDKNPSGVDIYAYSINGINPDTLNPATTKAEYRTQAGATGNFKFMALKNGKYRLIAVRDILKDGMYTEGADDFGAYTEDLKVKQDSIPAVSMKIGSKIDKIKPRLYNVESFRNRTIRAFFDEKTDSLTISVNSFILTDSSCKDTAGIISACISFAEQNCIELFTAGNLDTLKKWKLTAAASGAYVIKDSAGNFVDDTANYVYFNAVSEKDYQKPSIIKMPFRDSLVSASRTDAMNFILSSPVDAAEFVKRIKFNKMQDSSNVDFDIIMLFENVLTIKSRQPLENDQWYRVEIDFKNLKDFLGVQSSDTTYQLRFKTEDTRNWGRISGILTDSSKYGGNIYIVLSSADLHIMKSVNAGIGGKWSFDGIPPGEYHIEMFCDKDCNGAYSYGNTLPFVFAEPFKKLKESLSLKPRWNIDDIKIVF